MNPNKVTYVYVFVALARFLYGFDGAFAHYMFHIEDYAVAVYASAGMGIVIAVALLLPLSNRVAFFFAGLNAASGLIGFLIMGWLYVFGEEATAINPVLAPLVSAIAFSALLYFKPKLIEKPKV